MSDEIKNKKSGVINKILDKGGKAIVYFMTNLEGKENIIDNKNIPELLFQTKQFATKALLNNNNGLGDFLEKLCEHIQEYMADKSEISMNGFRFLVKQTFEKCKEAGTDMAGLTISLEELQNGKLEPYKQVTDEIFNIVKNKFSQKAANNR